MADLTEVTVAVLPICDICKHIGAPIPNTARYDGATVYGPWAYMCEDHFTEVGTGLGLGRGQRLVTDPVT